MIEEISEGKGVIIPDGKEDIELPPFSAVVEATKRTLKEFWMVSWMCRNHHFVNTALSEEQNRTSSISVSIHNTWYIIILNEKQRAL